MKKVLNGLTTKKDEIKNVWDGLDGELKAYIMSIVISSMAGYGIGYVTKKAYEYGFGKSSIGD